MHPILMCNNRLLSLSITGKKRSRLTVLLEVDALALADSLKHVLDTRHHTLQAAEVDVGTLVEGIEDLVGVLLNLNVMF
jgi:hypothetical protein